MAAYLVVFARIHDRARFLEAYAAPAAALVTQFGGEYVIRTPKTTMLEGDLESGSSAVISRWPDRAAIERFWTSPEYTALMAVRHALADCHISILEDPQ